MKARKVYEALSGQPRGAWVPHETKSYLVRVPCMYCGTEADHDEYYRGMSHDRMKLTLVRRCLSCGDTYWVFDALAGEYREMAA